MADDFQISTLNMAAANPGLAITEGAACDPPYLYVTPHNDYIVAKIDTRSFTVVDTLDLSQVDKSLSGMLGCFVVDGYLYILPHQSNSGPVYQTNVVRVDLANFTPKGCTLLEVFKAAKGFYGAYGFTDGSYGYIDLTAGNRIAVTRFGLGANYVASSVSSVVINTIDGYQMVFGNLVAVDKTTAYVIATVIVVPGTGNNDRQTDLWLVSIPTDNFTAAAAKTQRLTNMPFLAGSRPQVYPALDDGANLWCFPQPIPSGLMAGKSIGVMKIPKADPASAAIYPGPPSQPYPNYSTFSGVPIYDGWRYGYAPAQLVPQILQLDTQNPGTVNIIDISAASGGYPMFGLGYDGQWAYAVSFNGAGGLCLRFQPTPQPCPCTG